MGSRGRALIRSHIDAPFANLNSHRLPDVNYILTHDRLPNWFAVAYQPLEVSIIDRHPRVKRGRLYLLHSSEALGVVVLMGGGPAMVYATHAVEALARFVGEAT